MKTEKAKKGNEEIIIVTWRRDKQRNRKYVSNKEAFTDFVNERKLVIALILDGNEFHIRGPLCLSDF